MTASWTTDSKVVLNNVNIQLHKKKLYFLLGSAGSGKVVTFQLKFITGVLHIIITIIISRGRFLN